MSEIVDMNAWKASRMKIAIDELENAIAGYDALHEYGSDSEMDQIGADLKSLRAKCVDRYQDLLKRSTQ